MSRNLTLVRTEAEWLVDLLEKCDPVKEGSWRYDMASEVRRLFGMKNCREQLIDPMDGALRDLVRKHSIAVESLTEQQLADVIKQAITSGDFMRNVMHDGSSQAITYVPNREASSLRDKYNELIYAVATKHDGETRHETALRYINECESRKSTPERNAVVTMVSPGHVVVLIDGKEYAMPCGDFITLAEKTLANGSTLTRADSLHNGHGQPRPPEKL